MSYPSPAPKLPLRVSPDGRYLVQADGSPFFYLADTAWELLHRLDETDAERYLRNRAAKGFTVVMTVLLAELDGLNAPNAHGERPLFDNDPGRPNPAYMEHADRVIGMAEELGLVVALLPTWGDHWHNRQNTPGPRIFDETNAGAWGRYVGERYRDRAVIFVLGGDRNPETAEDRDIVASMARGLKETAPNNLVTYHPRGPGRSSLFFHGEPWLDVNMIQSSHTGRGADASVNVTWDRLLEPAKPTLDGEPRYEALMVDFYLAGANPMLRFDDYDVRVAAYRAMLAGAAGHTYGNNNIWQMWTPERRPVLGADIPWYEALDHPGAFQMGLMRRLLASRPWQSLVPDQELLVGTNPPGAGAMRAAVAADRSFALVYTPLGEQVAVNQDRLGKPELTYWWYDPRYGCAFKIATATGTGAQFLTPPSSGRGCDWVLVIDDPVAGFGAPGAW